MIANAPVPVGSAVQVVTGDGYRFYPGLRSDPFFLDADGPRGGFQFTSHDTFADPNVFGMLIEAPTAALGSAEPFRLWARIMAPVHGHVARVDSAGRPGVATVFNRTDADPAASTMRHRRPSWNASVPGSSQRSGPWATPRSKRL